MQAPKQSKWIGVITEDIPNHASKGDDAIVTLVAIPAIPVMYRYEVKGKVFKHNKLHIDEGYSEEIKKIAKAHLYQCRNLSIIDNTNTHLLVKRSSFYVRHRNQSTQYKEVEVFVMGVKNYQVVMHFTGKLDKKSRKYINDRFNLTYSF